ncbi:TetR/AcrR family transcriptional regulator [Lentilactobacillus raoultii]|uniref:TetR/AcrR family transcriptional regulator n=1 Tax=Lentilactobacillus raoultii TaxID=1987503 RepID=A0ABW3PK84_9LACO|nr:TetR/AcrR family transcriptional regulator [Lentilactobacillus raoultii]
MIKDKRLGQTKHKIQVAFIKLAKKSGFDHLTISGIIKTAKISRGTFYLHYDDKYDLLASYENQTLQDIEALFNQFDKPTLSLTTTSKLEPNNAFYQLFKYLYTHRSLINVLLTRTDQRFITQMKALIKQEVGLSKPHSVPLSTKCQIPFDFAEEIILQNIVSLINYWIGKERPEPPSQIYQIFIATRLVSIADLTANLNL